MHDTFTLWLYNSFMFAWLFALGYFLCRELAGRYRSWSKKRAKRIQERNP